MIPSTHRQRIPTLLPRLLRLMRRNRQRMLRRGLAAEGEGAAEGVAVVVADDEAARTVGTCGLSGTSPPHAAAAGPATAAGGAGATKGLRQG
eukprot:COSAG04_NODE_840_length_9955_cov_5.454038_4_plen_92_part_00